jgi:hypothetical protein
MILSLLRKKDMRIQDFMKRSFSEYRVSDSDDDPKIYLDYLEDKLKAFKALNTEQDIGVESCSFCNEYRMYDYYKTCGEYFSIEKELFNKLYLHSAIFKSLVTGRVVFVKATTKIDSHKTEIKHKFKLAPVILVESFNKDTNHVLALSLNELKVATTINNDDSLWIDQDDDETIDQNAYHKLLTFYDQKNDDYEQYIEKLKNFRMNRINPPFVLDSLMSYRNITNATLVQIKYSDIKAISTKLFQKNPQLHFDYSFVDIWSEQMGSNSNEPMRSSKRDSKFIEYVSFVVNYLTVKFN